MAQQQQPWTLVQDSHPDPEYVRAVGGHPLVARLLWQRGIRDVAQAHSFLDPTLYTPSPPTHLYGVAEAGALLLDAVRNERNFLVWGDFDVDGQTSTSLLVAALHDLAGSERVRYHVPNRFDEGHGILPAKLDALLAESDIPIHVLLTCDTGIAEAEAIGFAKDQGLTVIVTDHHDLTPEFQSLTPGRDVLWGLDAAEAGAASVRRADAVINPKFQPLDDPLRTLPGVGVAYKLVQHLFALSGISGAEECLLDLVALGIVADVAEQVNDARFLLQQGLAQLRNTTRIGLLALMRVAQVDPARIDTTDIGFQIGPRMNALGRLEDATVAVELLTTQDEQRAEQLAAKMERLNQERRLLTTQTTAAAENMIERDPSLVNYAGLVLAHEAWHPGIVGIVASRLTDDYGKPTVLLLTPPGKPARGSARSVAGVDIGAAIAACEPLLLTHGGHPGAAGLSLPPENIAQFRRELSRQIERHRSADAPAGPTIDAELPLSALTLELAEELQRLAPFGQGNQPPMFMSRNLRVIQDRRIGSNGAHRRMTLQDSGGTTCTAIWFNGADVDLPAEVIDFAYHLSINEFRGERSVQLHYAGVRAAQIDHAEIGALDPVTRTVHDWRGREIDPGELPAPPTGVWYAEGIRLSPPEETDIAPPYLTMRTDYAGVQQGNPLIVWSIPPSAEVLLNLVDTVEPTQIYLCGQMTVDDSMQGVLRNIAAMCKYALANTRIVDIDRMAARLGTTYAIVRQGLLWLEGRGLIEVLEWSPPEGGSAAIRIGPGSQVADQAKVGMCQSALEEQLSEVRAFRRFFLRARLPELGLG